MIHRSRLLTLFLALALAAVVLPGQTPAGALGVSVQIDEPSGYDAQVSCTTTAQPGTVALARWLQRTYPVTGSMGMMRACGTGGTSEHKDGRAFDWAADVGRASTKAAAYGFIAKALATDAAGNPHALARRLGIMYLTYDDTIWSSYRDFAPRPYLSSGCRTRASCSRTLRHLNHVHISLGYAGAAAQTSWYRTRNVTSVPVFYPRTKELDPDGTAVTGFHVPADGTLVRSPFGLRPGVRYRVVVTGTTDYGPRTGDANCIDAAGWNRTVRDPLLGLPLPTTHGLALAGSLRWQGDCRADHTYETWYTPLVPERLRLRYVDVPAAGNTGGFTVYVARDDITLESLAGR